MLRRREARVPARAGVSTALLVRVVLVVGILVIAGVFVLEMSRSGPRTAGSDHRPPITFSVFPTGGQTVCQVITGLPYDAAQVSVLVGTYGRPRPSVEMTFLAGDGTAVARAAATGGAQGYVRMPIERVSRKPASTACLHLGGRSPLALGGVAAPVGPVTARIDGKPRPGEMTIFYFRRGSETWWQLLPVLNQRFGWGKAPFFGDWTLPFAAALTLLLWAAAVGLAARRFR